MLKSRLDLLLKPIVGNLSGKNAPQIKLNDIPGTMSRFIYQDTAHPASIYVLLIWKSTELVNEAAFQRALEAFQTDFSDCLDRAHASFFRGKIIAHT